MFKKILLICVVLFVFVSSSYSLDVCGKIYTSEIEGINYDVAFMCTPFGPTNVGVAYLVVDTITIGTYNFNQNPGDAIVNLGDFGVFYQSPSDVLTFIPPPFMVFTIK